MLSILLTILKIIGLILLTILGFVLVILLTVLLVPIRYEAEAAMKEKQPMAKARVSWLLRFLCVRVRYGDDGFHYLVKVCGFSVVDSDKPKTEKQKKQKSKRQNGITETGEEETSEFIEKTEEIKTSEVRSESKTANTGDAEASKGKFGEKKEKKQKEEKKNSDKKKSLLEKLEDLKMKKDEISRKIKDIKARVEAVLVYLQSPKGRKLKVFLKQKLFRLLRHLKPKALQINGRIGLSDPSATGMILGVTYMLYPMYGEHIHLVGEFEEEVIEGGIYMKGRIRLGTLLLTAIQVILNKEVRMWIKKATGGNRK